MTHPAMAGLKGVLLLFALVLALWSEGSPATFTDSDYVYQVKNASDNRTCLYASFRMFYTIYYLDCHDSTMVQGQTFSLPPRNDSEKHIVVSGNCDKNYHTLQVSWLDGTNFSSSFHFNSSSTNWSLSQVSFSFNFANERFKNFSTTNKSIMPTFYTVNGMLFNRTFKLNQYFHCERCKVFDFSESTCRDAGVDCPFPIVNATNRSSLAYSYVEMQKADIFLGDFEASNPEKQLCIEDYIALQEMIVPIVVGGVLGLLLFLILIAYILAYIRRRQKEARSAQYEPVGDY